MTIACLYFEWMAILFVRNGGFQRALQRAGIRERDAFLEIWHLQRIGDMFTFAGNALGRGWRGCELHHLVVSTWLFEMADNWFGIAMAEAKMWLTCPSNGPLPAPSSSWIGAGEKGNPVRRGAAPEQLAIILSQSGAAFMGDNTPSPFGDIHQVQSDSRFIGFK